jgi:multiple sugar transport system substrate-binding protein
LAESANVTIEDSLFANGKEFLSLKPANQLDAHQNILQAVSDYEEMDMVRVPIGPGGASDDMGTNGISIGSNCSEDQVKAAAAWINFFLQNDEAAKIYLSDNGVVTVDRQQNAQAEDPATTPGQVKHVRLLQMIADDSTPTYYPNGYRPLIDALQRMAQAVAFGELTPESAADAFFEEADNIFGQGG